MTKKELIRQAEKDLAEYHKLPPEVRFRQMIADGTINEKGEVLLGRVPAPKGAWDEAVEDEEPLASPGDA